MHVFPLASLLQFTYAFRLRFTSILCFRTCVSILGHVHVPSEFELRCIVYLRSHIRYICIPFRCFPFVFHFPALFFYLLHSVHYQSVQIRVIAVCVLFNVCFLFFYHLMVPFKAFLLFAQFDAISVALKLHLQKKKRLLKIFKMFLKSLESGAQIN